MCCSLWQAETAFAMTLRPSIRSCGVFWRNKDTIDVITDSMSQKLIESVLNGLKLAVTRSASKNLKPAQASDCAKRIDMLFSHNMSGGKHQRSRLALNTFLAIRPEASTEQIEQASKVAGTLEMMQSFFLILDDIMDQSKTRRGKPCWYTMPGVGLQAINDAFFLDCGMTSVIRETIPNHPQMNSILATIQEARYKTVIGQFLDGASNTVEHLTWERYAEIVEYKTSHYSFYCPMAIGFQLADLLDHSSEFQRICYKIGYLFQAQDDFLDIFGDEKVTGKNSSDLVNGKCTWLACKTIEKISQDPSIVSEFNANFGQTSDECKAKAKKVIVDAGIEEDFKQFQHKFVKDLHDEIETFPMKRVASLMHSLVENLDGRKA